MESEKKNTGLYVVITILCALLVVLGGYIVFDKVLDKKQETQNSENCNEKCECEKREEKSNDIKELEQQECNCQKCDEEKSNTKEIKHHEFQIKVQKSFSITEKTTIDGESVDVVKRMYLLDNGTYCRYYQGEGESHDCGTYFIDNNILYVSSLLYGGNGSTVALEDVETDKYAIKENGLYDYKTNKLIYNVDNKYVNTTYGGIIQELYDFIYYQESNPYYSAEQRKLFLG